MLAQAAVGVVEAPVGLSEAARAVWALLAPHALAAKTLTPGTAAKFHWLCEAVVLRDRMKTEIDRDGLTSVRVNTTMDESGGGEQVFEAKAHPLLAKWQAQARLVDTDMLRFSLSPMGKPIESGEPVRDEWAEFDGPQLVKRA